MPAAHKPIPVKPLTGALEVRIPPDEMAPQMMRFRQNFCCDDLGKISRARGFSKFIGGNADLHDQLLPLQSYYDFQDPRISGDADVVTVPNGKFCGNTLKTRANGRETITFGFNVKIETGSRRTIVGTRSRLYALNETTKNYRIIGDGFGGMSKSDPRFYGAYLNNEIFFAHGVDQPVSWPIDGPVLGCEMQAVRKINDLEAIGLDTAGLVFEFNGCIFLFDITLDGVRFPNRYVWSDLNDGTSFDPAKANSITGMDSVAPGHTILAVAPLLSSLMIYTDRGIFRLDATGGNPPFTNTHVYNDDNGYNCLAYRNTLVSLGSKHFYAGADGFYMYDPYQLDPQRVDWMHSASGVMYQGIAGYGPIQKSMCETTVAEFKPNVGGKDGEGEIYISWAEAPNTYPTKTLVFNTVYEIAYTIDHGFSMFMNHVMDGRISVRDFLLQACACSAQELADMGVGFIKEAQPVGLCSSDTIKCILTKTLQTLDGYETEDWSASADSDSLCAYLGGDAARDICAPCDNNASFVGASTQDLCLKEIGQVYYREICTNPNTPTGQGTPYENVNGVYYSFDGQYTLAGYFSVMRGAPSCFNTRTIKVIERFIAEVTASAQSFPCALQLRVGTSYHVTDPNKVGLGGPIWYPPERKLLEETDTMAPEQYAALNIIPNLGMEWPLDRKGRWLYWELTIGNLTNPNDLSSPLLPATGGESSFSAIWQLIRQEDPSLK